jgi:hypothetical protein
MSRTEQVADGWRTEQVAKVADGADGAGRQEEGRRRLPTRSGGDKGDLGFPAAARVSDRVTCSGVVAWHAHRRRGRGRRARGVEEAEHTGTSGCGCGSAGGPVWQPGGGVKRMNTPRT